MTWTADRIVEQLRATDETERIEAKRGLNDAVPATVSAFSNEVGLRGGWIVFGVQRDDHGNYTVVGVSDPDRLQTDFVTQCRGRYNRVVMPEMQTAVVDGQVVVVAFVPEVASADKPVYLKRVGLPKGAYRRIGSVDQVVTDDDLHRFASLAQTVPVDRRPVPQAVRDDLDVEAVAVYRRALRQRKPGSELIDLDDEDLLHALGAVVVAGGVATPTWAGLVMFGTRLALRRLMPSARIDVLVGRGPALSDSYDAVEIREALVTGWRRAFQAVWEGLPRRVSLGLDALQRREVPRVPDVVLREAVMNALMHRDLEAASPVQIRSLSDRIEIENPGYSLVQSEDWGRLRSEARNPTLASMLHELDLAETRGTGVRRMRRMMQAAGLPEPMLVSDRAANWFRVTLSFHHLLDEADWDWLGRFEGVDDLDRQVLWLARRPEGVRNEEVRDVSGEGTLAASQRLVRLRDRGYLRREGGDAKQHAFYVVPEAYRAPVGEPVDPDGEPVDLDGKPVDLDGKPVDLDGKPVDLQLPNELERRLAVLPKKAQRSEVEAVIRDLCALRWFEPGDLAQSLGRNRSYLIGQFLKPMVDRGDLMLRFPDRKNHPRQAYGAPHLTGEDA